MRPLVLAILLAASIFGRAGATPKTDPNLPPYGPQPGLQGAFAIANSPLTSAWAEAFQRLEPGVKIVLGPPLTSSQEAIEALISGKVGLAWLGPEIGPQQRALAKKAWGGEPRVFAVATGGAATHGDKPAIAIYVNASNPIERLSLAQLDAIFSSSRKRGYPEDIVRWGQLGLSGEWAGPIRRYGMALNNRDGVPHGWVYFLMQGMMAGGEFKPDIVQVPDTAYGSGANRAFVEVVRDVAEDPGAIAYAPFEYRRAGVKTLALSETEAGPYYAGTSEEVALREYPLAQTRALAAGAGPLPAAVREFLVFVLSYDGQRIVAADPGGSLPLPAAMGAAERDKLNNN